MCEFLWSLKVSIYTVNVARGGWRWGEGRFERESFEVVKGFVLRLCRGCLGYREVGEQLFWQEIFVLLFSSAGEI